MGGAFQTSVVRRGLDVEKLTHQRVDVHLFDGDGSSSLAEVGSPRVEDGFHGLELVAVAVTSFLVQLLGRGHVLSDRKELALYKNKIKIKKEREKKKKKEEDPA